MSLDPTLLRSSFDLVIDRQPQLTARFYEIFFERYPQVRPLFARSGAGQAEMLQQALVAVIEHVEDASWLSQTLGAMGEKHVSYGVTLEMYDWVVSCLLQAMAEAAGSDWSGPVANAWAAALAAVSGLMKAGAQREQLAS